MSIIKYLQRKQQSEQQVMVVANETKNVKIIHSLLFVRKEETNGFVDSSIIYSKLIFCLFALWSDGFFHVCFCEIT